MEKKNSGSDYFGIGSISVSHCDKYLAYSIDLKGSEYFKIYLRDLGNGKNLEDVIEDTSGSITWSLDNKSFFYSKLDKFHRPRKIYRHFIGSAPENDELIFEEQDETFTCGISLSADEKFYIISELLIILHLKNIFFPQMQIRYSQYYFKRGKLMLDIL